MKKYIIFILLIISLTGCNETDKIELIKAYIETLQQGKLEFQAKYFNYPGTVDVPGIKSFNIRTQRLLNCSKVRTYQLEKDKYGTIVTVIVLTECKDAVFSQGDSIGKIYFNFSALPNKTKLSSVNSNLVAFLSDWNK